MSPTFDPFSKEQDKFKDQLKYCPFDKHKDREWEDVLARDRSYVAWLISGEGPKLDPELEEHLTDLLENDTEYFDTVETMYEDYRDTNLRNLRWREDD